LSTHYAKKQEQQRKQHSIGILRDTEEEVGRKRMWRRTTEDEIRGTGRSWNEVKGTAADRNAWKLFMVALWTTRSKRT
jgi:hypothetical protein